GRRAFRGAYPARSLVPERFRGGFAPSAPPDWRAGRTLPRGFNRLVPRYQPGRPGWAGQPARRRARLAASSSVTVAGPAAAPGPADTGWSAAARRGGCSAARSPVWSAGRFVSVPSISRHAPPIAIPNTPWP